MLDFGYETTFGSDNSHCLKLISGVRNVNEDYFTEGNSTLFLNGSDGIFPTIAANYEMANFPLSGVCPIHAVYAHNKGFKAQFSLYNGVAGELADGSTFRFRPRRDGVTALGEVAYLRPDAPRYMLYSVGFVSNNTPEADASGESSGKLRSAWFSLVEQGLLKTDRYSLNLMLQGSSSLNSGSECNGYFGSGLVLNRNSGENKIWLESLGLMNHYAKYSEAEECNQELTLQLNLYDLFLLKPSLQLVEGHGDVQKVFVLRLCYEIE